MKKIQKSIDFFVFVFYNKNIQNKGGKRMDYLDIKALKETIENAGSFEEIEDAANVLRIELRSNQLPE